MKNYKFIIPGAGVFSRLLQFGIIPLSDIDFDNVHLTLSAISPNVDEPPGSFSYEAYQVVKRNVNAMLDLGIKEPYTHIVEYVLDQKCDSSYAYAGYLTMGPSYDRFNRIEKSPRFLDYKRTAKKLKIKQEIITMADQFVEANQINEKVLGVHVRLTTMNMMHYDLYQQVGFDDYVRLIDRELKLNGFTKIFVASDNDESLQKLKARYGSMILSHEDFLRYPTESLTDFFESMPEYEWFYQKRFWQESFRECLVLSKCGGLICRESNFTNMAIVFSDSFKKISRVFHV